MNDPRNLSIHEFTYSLPEERIAKYPLKKREDSKLLVYKEGEVFDDVYLHIAEHLPKESLLVFNDTRVVAARILFKKPTGGTIEIFCLGPADEKMDVASAMLKTGKVEWQCLVGGSSKWKPGQVLENIVNGIQLNARYLGKLAGSFQIELSWEPLHLSFAEVLERVGGIPLPPYIKRELEPEDKSRYQTIYARTDGSVAAPTAGLHFSDTVMKQLKNKNIPTDFVTLHVGAGTFKPVKTNSIGSHEMHAEWMDVRVDTIHKLLEYGPNNIIAVGTTSLRTLESLYWIGKRIFNDPQTEGVSVAQWEPYDEQGKMVSTRQALESLIQWIEKRKMESLVCQTGILIGPGYNFRVVNGLVTNFHQPQSTLLLLIAAFMGDEWHRIYDHALGNGYRFLSYGDGSLLLRPTTSSTSF